MRAAGKTVEGWLGGILRMNGAERRYIVFQYRDQVDMNANELV